jgi:hypothetical protein
MKIFLLVFLVLILLPCFNAYAIMDVIDVAANSLLAATGIDQAIHYGQVITHQIAEIEHFVAQVEHMKMQAQQAVQNLESIKDIDSWDDFMAFYNRQLYLERKTGEAWDNMNIKIGKKDYHISDTAGMIYEVNDTYVDYWFNEFTEEQRREMWLELGLTPANYAYVQPFRARAMEHVQQGLTAVGIQNEWYMRQMEKNKERKAKMEADIKMKPEDKMGAKEVNMMVLDTLIDVVKVLNDMAMNQAYEREEKATQAALDNTPDQTSPPGSWRDDGFESLGPKVTVKQF